MKPREYMEGRILEDNNKCIEGDVEKLQIVVESHLAAI